MTYSSISEIIWHFLRQDACQSRQYNLRQQYILFSPSKSYFRGKKFHRAGLFEFVEMSWVLTRYFSNILYISMAIKI